MKLDFASKNGVIAAAAILEGEGHKIRHIFHPGELVLFPTILFEGIEEQAMEVFKFAINQGWPVMYLSKMWGKSNEGEIENPHWELNFAKRKSF